MARPLSSSEPHRNGKNGDQILRTLRREVAPQEHPAREVLHEADFNAAARQDMEMIPTQYDGAIDAQEVESLRDENQQLRALVAELEQHLEQLAGSAGTDEAWENQTKELECLLEEKSETIRSLHLKIQELQDDMSKKAAVVPKAATPHEEELMKLHDQLEKERLQLDEDEESMMQQMRQMEVQMAKERAEIARQRNELQRLHAEIRHELELAARDSTLRERLAPLQRRHQDITNRRGSSPAAQAAQPIAPPPATVGEPLPKKRESGLLRRLFR